MSISIPHKARQKNFIAKAGTVRNILLTAKKFPFKRKARLFSDLHLLVSSGLDIHSIFQILVGQATNEREKTLLSKVQQDIVSGSSMGDALLERKIAGSYEYRALRIGEESGNTVEVLGEITRFYERKMKQKRQVTKALSYPLLVLFTAILAVGFMLSVIVPMFDEVFRRFQGNLPMLTQYIINTSEWMKRYGLLVILLLAVSVILVRYLLRKPSFKSYFHTVILRIPLLGKLIMNLESIKFCHMMSLLIKARSPLVQSLDLVADVIPFLPLKKAIIECSSAVSSGNTLYGSMEQTGYFESRFTSLIRAAEEVNQLEYAFEQLNEQYSQETDHLLEILSGLLEPLLIVLVGGIVAIILIAMYLPLFQIGTTIY